ncbi:hypothetical protein ACHAPO_009277 [Fusarium lateritium]
MPHDELVIEPSEIEFEVEANPFVFTLNQLDIMITTKSLAAFHKLGSPDRIENGNRVYRMNRLRFGEEIATSIVEFEEAFAGRPLQEPPRSFSKFEHSDSSQFHSRRDEKLVSPTIDNRPSLAVEVKNVLSRLVKVRAKCTEIEQGHYRNKEKNSDISSEEWETLEAINRTLLDKDYDLSIAASSLSPQLQHFRKIASDHSLQSRNLRRFNDSLLPLLRREQDLESAQQWMAMMKLSSSLIDILGKNELLYRDEEEELLDAINQIDDILMELKLWFKRKYRSLNCKKDVTEEQNLVEIIFEFPNNIRHTCTTMPWTIRPALLVLWGVCWMFIIGAGQPGHEELEAVNPLVSPVSFFYGFYDNFPDFDIEDTLSHSIIDDADDEGYHGQNTLENLLLESIGMMNDPINALAVVEATPQDPDFLAHDLMSRNDAESLGLLKRHSAETLPAAAIQSSLLGSSISIGDTSTRDTTINNDVSGSDNRKTNSDDRVAKPKPRSVEAHQQNSLGSETLFHCPNSGCDRSNGKWPFKRDSALKRHLKESKCNQECLARQDGQTYSSTSASTPATQLQEVETEQVARVNELNKRLRPEDDEGSDELPLAGIWKKYKNMKEEVKQKKDAYLLAEEKLKAFEKSIQDLAGSLSNS